MSIDTATAMTPPLQPMLTSADDLLGRLQVAAERRICDFGVTYFEHLGMHMGLPFPQLVTNSELHQLEPVYHKVLSDIQRHEEKDTISPFLAPLVEAKETLSAPDRVVFLLYFLDYPNCVRAVRQLGSRSFFQKNGGTRSGVSSETFDMVDFADKITTNFTLQTWCRKAIANYSQHHSWVLSNAISLLASIQGTESPLSPKKLKKFVRQAILKQDGSPTTTARNNSNNSSNDCMDSRGFLALRADLARLVLAKPDLPGETVCSAIFLELSLLRIIYGPENARDYQRNWPNANVFELALNRNRSCFDDQIFQLMRSLLGLSQTQAEIVQAAQGAASTIREGKESIRCNREGCTQTHPNMQRCSGCRLANYCSRECQMQDWKNGHKKLCRASKKKAVSKSELEAATVRARLQQRPALVRQEALLAENSGVDYFLAHPQPSVPGTQLAIVFTDQAVRTVYRKAREHEDVYLIYRLLTKATTEDLHPHLRAQLTAEYGVDPAVQRGT